MILIYFNQIPERYPSLKDQGVEQLYPDGITSNRGRATEMKKLVQSILIKYLEIISTLYNNPAEFAPLIEPFRVLFINLHHLLNEWRPFQVKDFFFSMTI